MLVSKKLVASCLLGIALKVNLASAQSPLHLGESHSASTVELTTVVVTGAHPAPRLWELTRDGKTLLIMGTLAPAPRHMEWSSPQVEARLRQANIILESPGVSVAAEVGVVRGILLWPAYQASKKNPDGMRLEEVLSPDVFRRWIAFKHRFLGDDRSVDRLRPLFAAKALFNAALRDSGMNDESLVEPVVRRLAKRFSIPLQSTSVRLTVSDPRETLSKLNASHLNDQECLVRTMDRLEHDLAIMTLRANAWAEGDIDKLKALPFIDQKEACKLALMNNEIAREHGITDLDARVQQQWLTAVRTALSEKDTVFATLPIAKLLDGNGVLRTLQDEGFVVNAPE